MINEVESKKDAGHRAVIQVEKEIADALARKEVATRDSDRAGYDRAIADIAWHGERLKLAQAAFERVCREVDAEVRDGKLAELDREREHVEACTRRMATAAREAAELFVAGERLRGGVLALADEAVQHAERVRVLSRAVGVLAVVPTLSERDADELFGALVQRYAQRMGITIQPLRGLNSKIADEFLTREEDDHE